MQELKKFKINRNGLEVKGDYEGNLSERKVVILLHGFGVDRSARGIFSDIGERLKNQFLLLRFELNEWDSGKNL
jgi:hypothetical protein